MSGYGQFCPVAQGLEVLAERWTLLVVRELLMGSKRFNEIRRGVPLMSRSLLSQRLKSLSDCRVVQRVEGASGPEYHLTEAGQELRPIVESIGHWAKRYVMAELHDEDLDPKLLMWDIQRRLHRDRIPETRTVVLFRFSDAREGERRFWLHLARPDVDLCLTSSGFDVDLTVDCDVRTLTDVWLGRRSLERALRERRFTLEGPAALQRGFPGWLQLSVFAS